MRECIKAFANLIAADLGVKTSNMAKFTELKETSFYDRWNMFIHRHIRLKNYTEVFSDSLGEIVFKLRLMLTGTLILF